MRIAFEHRSMKNVMFHANDAEKHSVYWSELSQSFALENKTKGRFFSSPYLCNALTEMHAIVGGYYNTSHRINEDDYRALVSEKWTITENPYG